MNLRSVFTLLVIFMSLALIADARISESPPILKDGDKVVFYGDSITHHNDYVAYLYLFYATRYPEARIQFRNAGVGGNRTSSALPRFKQDVVEQSPSHVAVLFGMNDGNQRAFDATAYQAFQKGIGTILDRIQAETKAKAMLLTPTYFDYPIRAQHLEAGQTADPGYNEVLVGFGNFLKSIGKEKGLRVIDLNEPMVQVTRRLQNADPKASLIRDGVHPLPEGHFVMAHAILQGLDVAGTVSDLHIDVVKHIQRAERCLATDLTTAPDAACFTLLQEALPFPHPDELREILRLLAFDETLNRERLRISGLNAGEYRLIIDGEAVGMFSDEQFSEGLELASNPATPQYLQAMTIKKLWCDWRKLVKQNRDFRWMEKTRGYRRPDGTYPSDRIGTLIIGESNEVVQVSGEQWQQRFDALAVGADEVLRSIADIEERIYATARPRPHRYEIRPASSSPATS